jgi:predicted RecB family endonuclease
MSVTEGYHACRTLVRSMDMGEDIYRVLHQQLEQYLSKLLSKLNASSDNQVEWLDLLATEWRTFENRLVRT